MLCREFLPMLNFKGEQELGSCPVVEILYAAGRSEFIMWFLEEGTLVYDEKGEKYMMVAPRQWQLVSKNVV